VALRHWRRPGWSSPCSEEATDRRARGLIPGRAKKFFSSPKRSDRLWGPPRPLIKWVAWDLSSRVKGPKRELNHSLPSNTEVKNDWSHTSALLVCVHSLAGTTKFLGSFAKLRKATTTFVMSVCPSVRMEQLGSYWTDFH
jgi:hypothetical protein